MDNSYGTLFRIELFGASHAPEVGVIVSGCPAGLEVSAQDFKEDMARRRPGGELATPRKESDEVETREGVEGGKTTGKQIRLAIKNTDVRSKDYDEFKLTPRPGHADYTALKKYGPEADLRGGGIFSGRMTAPIVAAGVIAKKILAKEKITVRAKLIQVGKTKTKMKEEIEKARSEGDSVGGLVECVAEGLPAGIGEPFFDSVESVLSHVVFSIPGVKGVEFGSGFKCVEMKGSEHNDAFVVEGGKVKTRTNNAGGVLGGITDGMPLLFRVAFKPTSSIATVQDTVDLENLKSAKLEIKGRHDPCIALRAVPVVEAAAACALADLFLQARKVLE
ncbi:chorismate synthase [Candidatus Micrarchaeota archaeon]|nr:chorismate synthase [Candidatus Micrarchaeota archaeon]